MNIAFRTRHDIISYPAGDTIQILETQKRLQQLGYTVTLNKDLPIPDIIHIFNIARIMPIRNECFLARDAGIPYVVSPIYWPVETETLARNMMREKMLREAAWILPNSHAEKNALMNQFGIANKNIEVIYNGADIPDSIPEIDSAYADSVVYVGRIDPNKSQLLLLEALEDSPYKVILVGKPGPKDYYDKCRAVLDKRSDWLNIYHLERDQVFSIFNVAKVACCVSGYETAGLVNLEAGLMGCNIVSSGTGGQREYLGDFAFYCDRTKESVREAVDKAFAERRSYVLREKIKKDFNWAQAGDRTAEIYEKVKRKG